jgi:hypothetical protein
MLLFQANNSHVLHTVWIQNQYYLVKPNTLFPVDIILLLPVMYVHAHVLPLDKYAEAIGAGGAVCGCPPRFRTSRNPQRWHMRQPARSRFDFAGVAAARIASASLNTQAHNSHRVDSRLLAKDENSIAPSPTCSHIEAKSQAAHLHAAIGCRRAAGLNAGQGRA